MGSYTGDVQPGGQADVRELPGLTISKLAVSEMANNVYLLRDPATGELLGGDVGEQTRQTLAKLDAVLRTAGGSLADVVSVTAYLQDIGDWDAFNRAYGEAFTPPFPTRTTVGVDLGDVLVEISAVAYLPR